LAELEARPIARERVPGDLRRVREWDFREYVGQLWLRKRSGL
jgi:hypothetical protein